MTLQGFKITNHPQQVKKRGASDTVDERITPQWLFAKYDAMHDFTIDVAANANNAKCPRYYTREDNGLIASWKDERVWCNPPYSNIAEWVAKASHEHDADIVMLLPANRTEQRWWHMFVEPYRDRGKRLRVEFLERRLNFGVPGNEEGKFYSSPPFGLVVLTWAG